MALSDAESVFVESIMGFVPESGCYVYHIDTSLDPYSAREYFNSFEIQNHTGITTVYRKYKDLEPKLYIIILTQNVDDIPSIPEDMVKLVSGLGD